MVSEVTLSAEKVAADLRPVLLRLARELRKETEQLGITARQATFLWLVKRSPGLSLAELAAEEGISPPAMSGHVDRLERAGLLERKRSSDDRRRVGLRLSEEGDRLMRRVRARRTTWLADRLRTLEPEELEAIDAAVPALMRLVEPASSADWESPGADSQSRRSKTLAPQDRAAPAALKSRGTTEGRLA